MRLPFGLGSRGSKPLDPEERPGAQTQEAKAPAGLAQYLDERREEAARGAQRVMSEVALGLAYYEGQQWYERVEDGAGGSRLVDTRDTSDREWYRTVNVISARIDTNVARVTASRPDVVILPRTSNEGDKEAAEEARAVVDHYEEVNDGRRQLSDMATYALIGTTAYLWAWWDAEAMADVPVIDPLTGMVSGIEKQPVGELHESIIYGHQVYIDPRVKRFEDAAWVMVEEQVGIGEIQRRYGTPVQADAQNRAGLLDASDGAIAAPMWGQFQELGRSATVQTYWERPSDEYKKGRTVVKVGRYVLRYLEELPCGVVPLVPLGFRSRLNSPYDRNMVCDLAGPQRDRNLIRSRFMGMLRDAAKTTLVEESGSGTGADLESLIEEGPRIRRIKYLKGGTAPQFVPVQVPDAQLLNAIDLCDREMDDITSVHSVSAGGGDPNAKSGVAIRMLQDSDRTAMAIFMQRVERFIEERARMRVLFASHYVQEPRAWGMDDMTNPQEAITDLERLRSGAAITLRVIEASGTDRTPEVMDQQIIEWFGMGALGNPADPMTRALLFKCLSSPAASRVAEEIEKMAEAQIALPPLPGAPVGPEMGEGAPMMPPAEPIPPPPVMGGTYGG